MMPMLSTSSLVARPTALRLQAADRGVQFLAAGLAEQLRVAESDGGAAGLLVDDAQPHAYRAGDRAAADLVASDHQAGSVAQQLSLVPQGRDRARHFSPRRPLR